jgi:tetratricopeptide (TPR) repeat protein
VREVPGSNPGAQTIFMSTAMTRPSKIFLLALLILFVAFAAWLVYHETRVPQNQGELLNRMIELQREGRYDKAVQVVQNWMKDSRRDISRDELLYQQIAMVYIAKAYKKPRSRDESVHLAEMNLEHSLDLFEKEQSKDNNPWLFEVGGAYEILGNISDKDKCRLYETAREAFERQLPLIKGDSYTAYGSTVPLEPLRVEVRKHLDGVNKKSSSAGCQVH